MMKIISSMSAIVMIVMITKMMTDDQRLMSIDHGPMMYSDKNDNWVLVPRWSYLTCMIMIIMVIMKMMTIFYFHDHDDHDNDEADD